MITTNPCEKRGSSSLQLALIVSLQLAHTVGLRLAPTHELKMGSVHGVHRSAVTAPGARELLLLLRWSSPDSRVTPYRSNVLCCVALSALHCPADSPQGNIWEQIFQMSFILEMINTVPFIITVSHVVRDVARLTCSWCPCCRSSSVLSPDNG